MSSSHRSHTLRNDRSGSLYFRLGLPTPYSVGKANAYAVPDRNGLILIDSGPDSEEAWLVLEARLEEEGFAPRDVHTILLTHAHIDHAGLAYRFRKQFHTRVFAHPLDLVLMSPDETARERSAQLVRKLMIQHGAPAEIIELQIGGQYGRQRELWRSGVDGVFEDGQYLAFAGVQLRVIHTPGHTPGSVCFFQAESGALFSGDHLIPGVVPNPFFHFMDASMESRTRSFPQYIAALDKIRSLPVKHLCPGHREETENCVSEIDRLGRYFARGKERIMRLLGTGPIRSYDLIPAIKDPAYRHELFSFMYRNIGYLDVLEQEGRVVQEVIDGQVYYRPLKIEE